MEQKEKYMNVGERIKIGNKRERKNGRNHSEKDSKNKQIYKRIIKEARNQIFRRRKRGR